MADIPKPTIRNVILCYDGYSASAVNKDTKEVMEYFAKFCMKNCTIIFIVAAADQDTVLPDLRKQVQLIGKHVLEKSIVVFGICTGKVNRACIYKRYLFAVAPTSFAWEQ